MRLVNFFENLFEAGNHGISRVAPLLRAQPLLFVQVFARAIQREMAGPVRY